MGIDAVLMISHFWRNGSGMMSLIFKYTFSRLSIKVYCSPNDETPIMTRSKSDVSKASFYLTDPKTSIYADDDKGELKVWLITFHIAS